MSIFSDDGFIPRAHCGEWHAPFLTLTLIAHAVTFLAYLIIPIILLTANHTKARGRLTEAESLKTRWVYGLFIFFCGIGHALDAISFYWPAYHLFALWYALTGGGIRLCGLVDLSNPAQHH